MPSFLAPPTLCFRALIFHDTIMLFRLAFDTWNERSIENFAENEIVCLIFSNHNSGLGAAAQKTGDFDPTINLLYSNRVDGYDLKCYSSDARSVGKKFFQGLLRNFILKPMDEL